MAIFLLSKFLLDLADFCSPFPLSLLLHRFVKHDLFSGYKVFIYIYLYLHLHNTHKDTDSAIPCVGQCIGAFC